MLLNRLGRQTSKGMCALRISMLTVCLQSASGADAEAASPCDNPNLLVLAQTRELHQEVCTAAELALEFLSRYGLQVKHPIRINIVEQPLDNLTYSAYGSYDSRSDLVQVMSPQSIHQTASAPKVNYQPLDRTQYRGIVAHEVAHALIQQNSKVLPLPLGTAAQEYLATVTQLSILPPATIERVIRAADVGPWESGDVISGDYMAMSPERFAVKSYLHFHRHPMPAKFIDELLRSRWFYVNVE